MNILLVNDDGYYAEGIQRLKAQLYEYGNIYMVAPKNPMSAKGVSITVDKALDFEKIDEYNYVVDGTPADCVDFAVRNLKVKIDLVVSGCNLGLNYSAFSIWSGTLGACREAMYHFLPSIAFSATPHHMDHIDRYTKSTMDYIFKNKLPSNEYILSVNYPYTVDAKGIKLSRLSMNGGKIKFNPENDCLFVDGKDDIEFDDKDSDLYHTSHGYISITPLNLTVFNEEVYEKAIKHKKDLEFKK